MYDCVLVYFLWYVTQKIVNVCVIMSVNLFVDICCKYFAVFLFKKAIKELLVFFIPLDLHRTKLREPGSRGRQVLPVPLPLPTPMVPRYHAATCISYSLVNFFPFGHVLQSHFQRNQRSSAADMSLIGCQGTKFGTCILLVRTLLYIITEIGELWPRRSPLGAERT